MQALLQEEHVSDWEAEKRKALAGQTGFMGRGAQTPGAGETLCFILLLYENACQII